MKRDEIKAIFADATDEQLKAVMDLHGADVEKAKSRITDLESKLREKKEDFDNLNAEFETLKTANASGEDWKTKFEELKSEIAEKERQEEAEKSRQYKNENINNRFNTALGDKKFYNDPTREYYLKKFGEAIEAEENQGKSDIDVLYSLTKDDSKAFQGVEVVKLEGGKPLGASLGKYMSREEIFNIKDTATRQNEMLNHPDLFPEIQV